MEQLNNSDHFDLRKLFERAHDIYNKGYEVKMHEWHSTWLQDEINTDSAKKSVVDKNPGKNPTDGYKTCPKCGEEVPIPWSKHSYQKNLAPCGHVFKKEGE